MSVVQGIQTIKLSPYIQQEADLDKEGLCMWFMKTKRFSCWKTKQD